MEHAATCGQPGALAAVDSMVRGSPPHAVLFVGPPSSGKTTLALDLAAGLLCLAPDPSNRPCRACRGCRQVASGNHPDLHWLAPEGPGGQVRIGRASDPEPGTVRHLTGELALLPVEGGARVAIVESAHRLNEDAQNALLKLLEEPPPGVTIVLCADDDEVLLPTVRSRCVRVRLGPVAGREIERWLGELGAAEAPQAARLARISGGRPGLALAYARSPDAARLRGEIARGVLDLLAAPRRTRLVSVRALMAAAGKLNVALEGAREAGGTHLGAGDGAVAAAGPKRRKARAGASAPAPAASPTGEANGSAGSADGPPDGAADSSADAPAGPAATRASASAADRRAAASTLLEIWAAVGRDLAVAGRGGARRLADPELLDEYLAGAPGLEAVLPVFLTRLSEVGAQLEENVNPELALDVLALAWPRATGGR